MMTQQERLERARMLADELVRRSRGANQEAAVELRDLLAPPPTMADIIRQVPGGNHRNRIQAIGISHQGYYNLLNGRSLPSMDTRRVLAKLTGLSEEVIRQAGRWSQMARRAEQ